ncbi:MAG: signal peptidase II [Clostridia bacterium]|nr:signal peptidase II [Clostridia bacterium]
MLKGKFKIQFSKKSIIFIVIFAIILTVDLITKYYAKLNDWDFNIIKGVLEVHYTKNDGMAFSLLEGKSVFLILFSSVMIAVVVLLLLFIPERFTILKLSLYMILAGAIGNLIDRAYYGYVRDFLWMVIPGATCNVADIFIVVGTFLAIIDLLFLNEWAAFPLTKKAKAAQAEKKKKEEEKKLSEQAEPVQDSEQPQENATPPDDFAGQDKVE